MKSGEQDLGIEVKSSLIHGLGVFAAKPYQPGEVVLRWDISHIIAKEQFARLDDKERRYTHTFDENQIVLVQPPERFVNHSCDNNTVVRTFCDVAVRYIAFGEEITSDYSSNESGSPFVCSCGAGNCRGKVERQMP